MIVTDKKYLKSTKCKIVTLEEASNTIAKLEAGLKWCEENNQPGIGLAAIQMGIPERVAIIRLPDHKINLANFTIDKFYDEMKFSDEGCLSLPGVIKNTKRYNEIVVSNNLFEPHSFIATGLLAVAIQHELDHLNNILISDREFVIKKGFIYSSKKRKRKNV